MSSEPFGVFEISAVSSVPLPMMLPGISSWSAKDELIRKAVLMPPSAFRRWMADAPI